METTNASHNTSHPNETTEIPEVFLQWWIGVVFSAAIFTSALILFIMSRYIRDSECCQENCGCCYACDRYYQNDQMEKRRKRREREERAVLYGTDDERGGKIAVSSAKLTMTTSGGGGGTTTATSTCPNFHSRQFQQHNNSNNQQKAQGGASKQQQQASVDEREKHLLGSAGAVDAESLPLVRRRSDELTATDSSYGSLQRSAAAADTHSVQIEPGPSNKPVEGTGSP